MQKIGGILFSLMLFGMSPCVHGENDQTVVIGVGLGLHNFSTTDDLRQSTFLSDQIDFAGASHIYVEWYALEELGFGLRVNSLGVTETVSTTFSTSEREFSISNKFITVNWVPLGANLYTRLGILAGIGNSEYEYTQKSNGVVTFNGKSNGPASLLGAFIDWGGEDFGARFGLNFLHTNLDDLNGAKVDASGRYWAFDIRWAFR